MLLASGCPSADDAAATADRPTVSLPPPLVGGASELPTPEPVDPEQWRLTTPPGEHAPWLRLVYAQDTRAELEACGCPGAASGGYARRLVLLDGLRAWLPDVLLLEGPVSLSKVIGGTESVASQDRARAREIIGLLGVTGVEAFFPGQPDFAVLAPKELASAATSAGVKVVATNLAPAVRPPSVSRFHAWEQDGRRVLILGLLGSPRSDVERKLSPVVDVLEATRAVIEEAGPADVVVAFTAANLRERRTWLEGGLPVDVLLAPFESPTDQAERWVDSDTWSVRADPLGRALRRVDIALTGTERGVARRPLEEQHVRNLAARERAWLDQHRLMMDLEARIAEGTDPRERAEGLDGAVRVDPTTDPDAIREVLARIVLERGKSLSALPAGSTRRHVVAADLLALPESLPEDPAVAARLDAYQAKWIDTIGAEFAAAEPPSDGGAYVGMDACVSCHQPIYAGWTHSAHGRAYRDIYERGEHRNPDCLGCHTTGFGVPGGFADPSDTSLFNVQCEACHGPMDRHVREAQRPGFKPGGGATVTEQTCLRCHDPANSPSFDYAEYLPRIGHPGVGAPAGGAPR